MFRHTSFFNNEQIENVLFSEYDTQDAENNLLSSIRRNYFTHGGIKRKNEIIHDNNGGSLLRATYSMSYGSPMQLNVKCGKNTVMRSKKLKKGSYMVDFYAENGFIRKKCVFSNEHEFIKILYFDSNNANDLAMVLLFGYNDGERVITLSRKDIKDEKLFLFKVPDGFKACDLAYDVGVSFPLTMYYSNKTEFYASQKDIDLMLKYAEDSKKSIPFSPSETGFSFSPSYFTSTQINNGKNRFESNYNDEIQLETDDTAESISDKTDPSDIAHEEIIDTPMISASTEVTTDEFSDNEEADTAIQINSPSEKPDCVINNANEKYLYYGDLDENGDRTGLGRTMLKNGNMTYYGDYVNDKRSGFGSYYYKSGKPCYFGYWKENKRDGMGIGFRNSDGEIHAGSWQENKPQGLGVRLDERGIIKYIADFKDGQRNGVCISFDKDGNIVITKFKDGVQLEYKRIIDINDL